MPKPGYITASVFNSVMTKSFGKTVVKECCRIACERIGVQHLEEQFDIGYIGTIEWGKEMEPLAVRAYEAETFETVSDRDVFVSIPGTFIGGTPDGLVGDAGLVEIKCPNSANHLLNLTQDEQLDSYMHQIQAYMWITDRDWCDFVSFDPRFPEHLQLHTRRVERDDSIIASIQTRADEMEDRISEMVEKLTRKVAA